MLDASAGALTKPRWNLDMAKKPHIKIRPKSEYLPLQRPWRVKSLVGQKFGRLTVVSLLGRIRKTTIYECLCDCGGMVHADRGALLHQHTRSCGCLITDTKRVHGMSDGIEHSTWMRMRQRCENPKDKAFRYYGARGIKVCERWNDFRNFLDDMGERPHDSNSIDRGVWPRQLSLVEPISTIS